MLIYAHNGNVILLSPNFDIGNVRESYGPSVSQIETKTITKYSNSLMMILIFLVLKLLYRTGVTREYFYLLISKLSCFNIGLRWHFILFVV